ncbi:hypothetical protein SKAU_G00422100 [Synaphobranchus kaupii]|uniref:Uncharacterized protein n=1 Tax=Synaphobranchus kaupii TaxID=118154 RepID=A0A9Q1IBA0_SYNKA|nr:hypothetical protein SKAU_G00422100 [Synaphobranchus kaupii]
MSGDPPVGETIWSSALSILLFYHTLSLTTGGSHTPVTGVHCPPLRVKDWDLTQAARSNITGFNLVQRLLLWETPEVEKIWTPKGSLVLRLGKVSIATATR